MGGVRGSEGCTWNSARGRRRRAALEEALDRRGFLGERRRHQASLEGLPEPPELGEGRAEGLGGCALLKLRGLHGPEDLALATLERPRRPRDALQLRRGLAGRGLVGADVLARAALARQGALVDELRPPVAVVLRDGLLEKHAHVQRGEVGDLALGGVEELKGAQKAAPAALDGLVAGQKRRAAQHGEDGAPTLPLGPPAELRDEQRHEWHVRGEQIGRVSTLSRRVGGGVTELREDLEIQAALAKIVGRPRRLPTFPACPKHRSRT